MRRETPGLLVSAVRVSPRVGLPMSVEHLQQAARGPTGEAQSDPSLPRRDLDAALSLALARDAHLLAAGELQLLRRFAALPEPARALFARLHARKPAAYPVSRLDYTEVPCTAAAAQTLVAAGMAEWAHAQWPDARLAAEQSVALLRARLREAGHRTGGTRAQLLERCARMGVPPDRREPRIALRHRGLFRRVVRLALAGGRGGLERLVLARLGVLRFPAYTPTGGAGLWRTRRALVAWEEGARRRARLDDEEALADLPRALGAVEASPPGDPFRARWSARRHDEALCLRALALLERTDEVASAIEGYQRLLAARGGCPWTVRKRLALCLARAGRLRQAVEVCAGGLAAPGSQLQLEPGAWALNRTGRQLARKARTGWRPLPPLDSCRERTVRLPSGPVRDRRPTFVVGGSPRWVEPAVVAALGAVGREARHVERALWTTLFAVLLRPALFAPVPGMLPSPLLRGPLDLGTPSFWRARASVLESLLARVAQDPVGCLDRALAAHGTEAVVGTHWDLVDPGALREVVADLPGSALAAVLRVLAQDWRGGRRGLPDLVVLPGPAARLPGAALGRLPASVLFVEIKTPRDRLSDEQRIWLHRLGRAGAAAEVWRVEGTG